MEVNLKGELTSYQEQPRAVLHQSFRLACDMVVPLSSMLCLAFFVCEKSFATAFLY